MFQYPCLLLMIHMYSMQATPIRVEKCLLLSSGVDLWSLLWILVGFCLFLSTLGDNCLLRAFSYFTSTHHGAIRTAVLKRVSMKKDYQHCLDQLAAAASETKSALIRSLLPAIETALNSGQRLKSIWDALRKEGLQMSYHSFHKTVSRGRKMKNPTASNSWGKQCTPSQAQALRETEVKPVEERDPLANLKLLDKENRPGFHWRGTKSSNALVYGSDASTDKNKQ
jgi:hypothetical protein